MKEFRTWREVLIEQLAADWEAAIDYLQVTVEDYQVDGNTRLFIVGLQTFIESQGGIAKVAKKIGIAPESLSEILVNDDPPRIDTLGAILKAFGCRLTIEPLEKAELDIKTQSDESIGLNTATEKVASKVAEAPPS
jgi:DNA-binding phage protein